MGQVIGEMYWAMRKGNKQFIWATGGEKSALENVQSLQTLIGYSILNDESKN